MPEGHTIHRLARDQNRDFAGKKLRVSSPQGRFTDAAEINGRRLDRVEAFGKHLFYWWSAGRIVHVHLGLYGKYRRHKPPVPEPRGAVRMRVIAPDRAFDLNGPTACELLDKSGRERIVNRLGQDPLRDDADPDIARRRILRSRAAIGRLLLDQSVIAGVGNIFRTEAMFLAGVHPERRGIDLTESDFDALWTELDRMLRVGVRYNRIITTDPGKVGKPRSRMTREERLHIYARESCPRCAADIRRWELGARKVFACEKCQPPAHDA